MKSKRRLEGSSDEEVIRLLKFASFNCFKLFYLLQTGNRLETQNQLIEGIKEGTFTLEDLFLEYINHLDFTEDQNEYWGENIEKFDFNVYFPKENKKVGEGAWIKVYTDSGYEVHWANKSKRKDYISREYKKTSNKRLLRELNKEKVALHLNKLKELEIRLKIGLEPYEVYYYRTKTQKQHLTTDKYEYLGDDIERIINYIMNRVSTVKVRSLFSSSNKDQIFYLRSRGIPKQLAMLMSNLKQCYFKVDLKETVELYNSKLEEFKEKIS